MPESLFNKVAGPQACNFIKMRLQYSCFPVKFAKFLRTPSFTEHLQWLLLWFKQQNNLIFSVITITFSYNQKLSWKNWNYYHPLYIKIPISYQKYDYLVQNYQYLYNFLKEQFRTDRFITIENWPPKTFQYAVFQQPKV